jgi:type IV secretory pathway TrbF-like protein
MPKDMDEARRLYLEQYGSALVTNSYLRIALFVVSATLAGAVVLSISMFAWAKNQKPLVVRIDEVGRATPINYSAFNYKPEEVLPDRLIVPGQGQGQGR